MPMTRNRRTKSVEQSILDTDEPGTRLRKDLTWWDLTVFGVSNKARTKAQRAAAVPRFVAEVMPLFASGRIRPLVDRVFDFADLPAAKARMESGAHAGKIVLRAREVSSVTTREGANA